MPGLLCCDAKSTMRSVATYAIGDLQGCYEPLTRLLAAIDFSPARDRLWLVGDLCNRGPDSLAVLRWAQELGDACTVVLGNHDLHLLAVAAGVRQLKSSDTLGPVLAAPDRDALLAWLAQRPLAVLERGHLLVHAGLLPAWSPAMAVAHARELEGVLRGPDRAAGLRLLYAARAEPTWRDDLAGAVRLATIAAALTRLRACDQSGAMALDFSGTLDALPAGLVPWFEVPGRDTSATVIFGHWAALGARRSDTYIALDSGCVWGRELTAVRLEDRRLFSVPAKG